MLAIQCSTISWCIKIFTYPIDRQSLDVSNNSSKLFTPQQPLKPAVVLNIQFKLGNKN
jgi:hypothetical protein